MKISLAAPLALLAFLPPLAAAEPKFRAVEIDAKIQIGYGITTADVDGDKKPDIVLCDARQIVWYRNPGWEKFVIAENLTEKDHVCVAAADIDGDGRAEIAVGAGWNPGDTQNSGALFYLLPPADRTQKWEPVKLPHEPTEHRIRWARDWQGRMTLISAPLHGRGNNPQSGEGAGVKIRRLIPPDNKRDAWEVMSIDESLHKTHNFDVVNWDEDDAMEFLIAGKEGVFVSNWSPDEQKLVLTQLGSEDNGGCGEVRLGRAGGTRFIAAVSPMHGNQLVAFTPPAGADQKLWTRTVLDDSIIDGHALACGDLLGLGQDQIVVGWRAMNRPGAKVGIRLFIPQDKEGKAWKPFLVDDNTMACEDLCLADLNADGKLDIIAAGRATKNVKVYFNESK